MDAPSTVAVGPLVATVCAFRRLIPVAADVAQCFSSDLNLEVRLHLLFADSVGQEHDGPGRFYPAEALDTIRVQKTIRDKVLGGTQALNQHGLGGAVSGTRSQNKAVLVCAVGEENRTQLRDEAQFLDFQSFSSVAAERPLEATKRALAGQ